MGNSDSQKDHAGLTLCIFDNLELSSHLLFLRGGDDTTDYRNFLGTLQPPLWGISRYSGDIPRPSPYPLDGYGHCSRIHHW
jgi:hypothetical protein